MIRPALPLISLALVASASAQTVYTEDFTNGAGPEWSSPFTGESNGERYLQSPGSLPGTNSLSLAALPAHDALTVTFDLYIIRTWDGNAENAFGPDAWGLGLDGTGRFLATFSNIDDKPQSFPAQIAPFGSGASNPPRMGQFEANHLGFGAGNGGDATYRIILSTPHTAPTAVFDFTGYQTQGASDEDWGLDNVTVVASGAPVPEPATLAALALGAALLRRRR